MKILTSHCGPLSVEGSQFVTRTGGTNRLTILPPAEPAAPPYWRTCVWCWPTFHKGSFPNPPVKPLAPWCHSIRSARPPLCRAAAPLLCRLCSLFIHNPLPAPSIRTPPVKQFFSQFLTAVTCFFFFSQPMDFLLMSTCHSESPVSCDARSHCGKNRKRNLVLTNKQSRGGWK